MTHRSFGWVDVRVVRDPEISICHRIRLRYHFAVDGIIPLYTLINSISGMHDIYGHHV